MSLWSCSTGASSAARTCRVSSTMSSGRSKTESDPSSRSTIRMTIKPPRPLGKHGEALWHSIESEYHVSDSGGVELLAQACAALDRAEQLAAEIAKDGAVICTA